MRCQTSFGNTAYGTVSGHNTRCFYPCVICKFSLCCSAYRTGAGILTCGSKPRMAGGFSLGKSASCTSPWCSTITCLPVMAKCFTSCLAALNTCLRLFASGFFPLQACSPPLAILLQSLPVSKLAKQKCGLLSPGCICKAGFGAERRLINHQHSHMVASWSSPLDCLFLLN